MQFFIRYSIEASVTLHDAQRMSVLADARQEYPHERMNELGSKILLENKVAAS